MKVRYRRTGGIANVPRKVEIDSSSLPKHFQELLNSLTNSEAMPSTHSDDFFHELYLEDGRTIRYSDSTSPPDLLELFELLNAKAQSR